MNGRIPKNRFSIILSIFLIPIINLHKRSLTYRTGLVSLIFLFLYMPKEWSPAQLSKIEIGKRYIKNNQDADSLYVLVVTVSPSVFSNITDSNTDTVWSRVENPGSIKIEDMVLYAATFDITPEEFLKIALRQIEHNKEEIRNRRKIGRDRFHMTK